MKKTFFILLLLMITGTYAQAGEYLSLSQKLITTAMHNEPYEPIARQLAEVDETELAQELDTDNKKKAFWLNVYNGYVQHLLKNDPGLFEDRDAFFKKKRLTIAGHELSLDEVEHGMIRGSKVKLLLGYLGNPFASKFEKRFRVDELDPRIHFALNCGAKSCPAVAIYEADRLDEQLDQTTRDFLEETTIYKPEAGEVHVTSLFSWFRGDFGGKSGTIDMLKKYDIIPPDAEPSLHYKDYDWSLYTGNYKEL